MRTSKSVCLICRHRLATKAAAQSSPWRFQAALAPAFSTGSGLHDAFAAESLPSAQSANAGSKNHGQPGDPSIRRTVQGGKRPKPRMPSKPGRRTLDPKANTDMDNLFRQIIERPDANKPSSDSAKAKSMNIQLVQDIGKLQDMLDANEPVSQAFAFLQTVLYPIIKQEGVSIPKVFHTVVSTLMSEVIHAKKNDMLNSNLPSVAEIFRIYADLGDFRPADWLELTGNLVKYICDLKMSPDDYPSIAAFQEHLAVKDEFIKDLVESWKVFSLPRAHVAKSTWENHGLLDGFWFPRIDKSTIVKYSRSKNFSKALSSLYPEYAPNQLGDKFSVLAIATVTLLTDNTRSTQHARQIASRFVAKVSQLMSLTGVNDKSLRRSILVTFPTIENYIMGQWPRIEEHLKASDLAQAPSTDGRTSPSTRAEQGLNHFEKKLSYAYGTRNLNEVQRLWHDFLNTQTNVKIGQPVKPQAHIFDSFINTYMALNKPDNAIEVWNTLPKFGLKPTLRTWNVMLDGCKRAKNLKGLQTVWQRLVDSGTRLDMPIWVTRIAGLMECNNPAAAIAALDEMSLLWRRGQQDKYSTAVQPTIEPVNAALSGLLRLNNHNAVQRLLAWAKEHNITPDIYTFNLLLRPLILDGRIKEVDAIFRNMETLGVSPDASTYTIMLEGTMTRLDVDDSEKQVEVVESVIKDMKEAGLEANHFTYGKIIHLLLRSGSARAQDAVKALLDHIWKQNMELSPHIYTSLVEHYFSLDPPDVEAVNKLVAYRRIYDYDDMDRIFYDRVINGYAASGHVETALNLWRKLSAAGFLVKLDAQYELLRVLLINSREDEAWDLVSDSISKFTQHHGEGGWMAHRFWHTAESNGFIEWVPDAIGGKAVIRSRG